MLKIAYQKSKKLKAKPDVATLGFGKYFTDHMFMADFEGGRWTNHRIVPFGSFLIHPASTVLHYAAEIFEGLKVYRRPNGAVQLFRPLENAHRLNDSAARMCLPTIEPQDFLQILTEFVALEKDWVPSQEGASLYLRPYIFGNDEALGVHPVKNATFMLIGSPVGSYYKEGLNPIKILVESHDVRAVRGGTGEAKCGGNYAASLRAAKRAEDLGYSQVLWLDGIVGEYIEEVGSMNVMFCIDGEVVTPNLSGSILSGITRKSCIELLRSFGVTVVERPVSIAEIIAATESGKLTESWGTGTAAVIAPIGELCYKGKQYSIGQGKIGKNAKQLYDTLTGIQWGKLDDTWGWTHIVQ